MFVRIKPLLTVSGGNFGSSWHFSLQGLDSGEQYKSCVISLIILQLSTNYNLILITNIPASLCYSKFMRENKRRDRSRAAPEFEVTLARVASPDRADRLRRAIDLILAAAQQQEGCPPGKTDDTGVRKGCP